MSNAGLYRLGQPVARPDNFSPDRTFSTGGYTYAFDRERRIGCQLPTAAGSLQTQYFTLERVSPLALSWRHWLRRGLILLAILAAALLAYPYYPAVEYQAAQSLGHLKPTLPAVATVPLSSTNELTIPAIGVHTPILEGSNINVLLQHEGVWHQTGALPNGDLVLAGHRFRYLPPNTSTFYDLGHLQGGDQILVNWYGRQYQYQVQSVTTIPATDTEFLTRQVPAHLYLYTCQDWLMTERILVTATLIP